jgi:hypothetical protein
MLWMEAASHADHHHEMPTAGRALDIVALSATLHCLTGCALGEIAGMMIGTALGFSDLATIALAVVLAFLFGYSLTSLPLLRAGLALATVIPIAFASDTLSIAVMEVVDNGIMLIVPGAMDAGVFDVLFWGSLSVALVIAGAFAFPVNRWLIARGKGHTAVHETGIHGGPPTRVVAAVAVVAGVFGTAVLVAEAIDNGGGGHMEGQGMAAEGHADEGGVTMNQGAHDTPPEAVRGLAISEGGMRLELEQNEIALNRPTPLRFSILDALGKPVRDFETEHTKRLHLIVVRRDMTGFQHLHPELGADGMWSASLTIARPGSYRVFADFKRNGENETLASDLAVDGAVEWQPLPAAMPRAETGDSYAVEVDSTRSRAGGEAELRFDVTRDGAPVKVEPYLGADGHLVALREGDLAYLHVHPLEQGDDEIVFMTEFPTDGRYRLFLQFRHDGRVHTAAFTHEVSR